MNSCRLCLYTGVPWELLSLSAAENSYLPSLIQECVSVNVANDANAAICHSCLLKLEEWREFKDLSLINSQVRIDPSVQLGIFDLESDFPSLEPLEPFAELLTLLDSPPRQATTFDQIAPFENNNNEVRKALCARCGKFVLEKKLESHCSKYRCSKCKCRFTNKPNLNHHIVESHPPKGYTCYTCGLKYLSKKAISVHVQKHMEIRPLKCQFCGMAAKTAHALSVHLEIHNPATKHYCEFCCKSFKGSRNLRDHKRRMHTYRKVYHECTICDKAFPTKYELSTHFRLHSEERRFNCPICGKVFATSHGLKKHFQTHFDERNNCSTIRCTQPLRVIVENNNN